MRIEDLGKASSREGEARIEWARYAGRRSAKLAEIVVMATRRCDKNDPKSVWR